jgi:hypothetical protein
LPVRNIWNDKPGERATSGNRVQFRQCCPDATLIKVRAATIVVLIETIPTFPQWNTDQLPCEAYGGSWLTDIWPYFDSQKRDCNEHLSTPQALA